MPQQFEEPEVLATFDRSFRDRREELRLERGEFNGRPTFTLRVYWQTPDGAWRWSQARPSQSGKCWQALSLKARELRDLGAALMAAADERGASAGGQHAPIRAATKGAAGEERGDDIPF